MIENDLSFHHMIEGIRSCTVLFLDQNGRIMNWSKGAEQMTGYKAEEIIGKNIRVFYQEEDQKKGLPEAMLNDATLKGETNEEGWVVRKDGSLFWGSNLIAVIYNKKGVIQGYSKIICDQTDKKNTKEVQKTGTRTSEVFLKILNASPSGMIILDADTRRIIQINKNFIETFGYSREEPIGLTVDELGVLTKQSRTMLAEKLKQQGLLKNENVICLTKDGMKINCIVSADLFEMDDRQYILSVYHDITERLKAEETERSLVQTREGLIKLFNASPVGMAIIDVEMGRSIEMNTSFLSAFGYQREEAIGLTPQEMGLVTAEIQLKIFDKLKKQGYLRNETILSRTKGGKEIDVVLSIEQFEMDDRPYFLCIFHDISEIKEMEKKLAENENKYRKLIEEAGDVLYTSDVHGNFTYINQRVTNLTGYSSDELLGKHFSVLIAAEWLEKVTDAYLAQFKNRTQETVIEFPIQTKAGERRWVEQIVIMQQTKDRVHGFQCIVHDITERKTAALLLTEQKQIIEQKNKNIFDSINYSKRIQDAIFLPDELLKELLPQSFILFKPKDVIGGDFYWLEKFENKTFIAAVDCTGHGVPGALLSIIGYNLLSKSINEHGHIQPSDILNELSNGINKTLRKTSEHSTVKDTMGISLCSIDRENNVLEYAGANNSLYIIRKNEIIRIPADRFAVGIVLEGELRKFTNHKLQLEKGDAIYLFTDGYPDQFGGPLGKKLKYSGFKNILLSIQHLSLPDQKTTLNRMFEEWRMKEDQTDDVLIIGIRI